MGGWKRGAQFKTDAKFWHEEVCSLHSTSEHFIAEILQRPFFFFAEEVAAQTAQVHTLNTLWMHRYQNSA